MPDSQYIRVKYRLSSQLKDVLLYLMGIMLISYFAITGIWNK